MLGSNDQAFWETLQELVNDNRPEEATELISKQMEAWEALLQRMLDKLTHSGNQTVH